MRPDRIRVPCVSSSMSLILDGLFPKTVSPDFVPVLLAAVILSCQQWPVRVAIADTPGLTGRLIECNPGRFNGLVIIHHVPDAD